MIGRPSWKLVLAMLVVLTVSVTTQALARDFGRGPRGGGEGPMPPPEGAPPGPPPNDMRRFGRLIEQLIYPCRNDCVEAQHACVEATDSNALTCATQTCDAAIQAARTDCPADRTSSACRSDIATLKTCIQPCIDAQSTTVTSCLDTLQACLASCAPTPTPTP